MKLIVVTTPTFFVEEDKIITALFEEGLDILHLRKPETPAMYSERLLTLIPEKYHQYSLFDSDKFLERNRRLQKAVLEIKNKYGKNAILKGMDLMDSATTIQRNHQIGGHKSGE